MEDRTEPGAAPDEEQERPVAADAGTGRETDAVPVPGPAGAGAADPADGRAADTAGAPEPVRTEPGRPEPGRPDGTAPEVPGAGPEPQPESRPESRRSIPEEPPAAPGPDPFAVVADALDGLRAEVAGTNERISRRLLADRERRAGIDVLQGELNRTREAAEGRRLQPLLYDLVLLLDRVEREPSSPFLDSVRVELLTVLEKYGMRRVSEEDGTFDPAVQEAVGTVPAPAPHLAGTVAETVRPGYTLEDRVVRPRQVTVYTAP